MLKGRSGEQIAEVHPSPRARARMGPYQYNANLAEKAAARDYIVFAQHKAGWTMAN